MDHACETEGLVARAIIMRRRRRLWLVPAIIAGCASSPGTRPGDMSASRHEVEARTHEDDAASHDRDGDAARSTDRPACPPVGGVGGRGSGICWTSAAQATSDHVAAAEAHRRAAAEHRAASRALREAEARACDGLADADRDTSPFARTEDIVAVAPLTRPVRRGETRVPTATGVIVTFRTVPGLTTERLQRLVDCHLARNAALGHEPGDMDECPLVPRGASAHVTATREGFEVAVRGADDKAIDAIVERGQKLKTRLGR